MSSRNSKHTGRTVLLAAVALGAAALCGQAIAQAAFPNKPIRLIVAVAPGGGADTMGRMSAGR